MHNITEFCFGSLTFTPTIDMFSIAFEMSPTHFMNKTLNRIGSKIALISRYNDYGTHLYVK